MPAHNTHHCTINIVYKYGVFNNVSIISVMWTVCTAKTYYSQICIIDNRRGNRLLIVYKLYAQLVSDVTHVYDMVPVSTNGYESPTYSVYKGTQLQVDLFVALPMHHSCVTEV